MYFIEKEIVGRGPHYSYLDLHVDGCTKKKSILHRVLNITLAYMFHFPKYFCEIDMLYLCQCTDIFRTYIVKGNLKTAVIVCPHWAIFHLHYTTVTNWTNSHIAIEIIQSKCHRKIIEEDVAICPLPGVLLWTLSVVQSYLEILSSCCRKFIFERKNRYI